MKFYFTIVIISLLFTSCKKPETVFTGGNTTINVPEYIEQKEALIDIPTSGIELGAKLFNDQNLSSNGTVSCATCHETRFAFSDDVALNQKGVSGGILDRNSPPLFNLAWHKGFFWDGGAPDLESQVLGPLFEEKEMDADLADIIAYLNQNQEYKDLFNQTYQDDEINSSRILEAFKWFQISLISFNTKYDTFVSTGDSSLLTPDEKTGLNIFTTNCNSCHTLPLGSSYNYENNKLDTIFDYPFEDPRRGRERITGDEKDFGTYKVPSIRNLSFTAPYMHDGRLENLDAVINHYNGKTLKDSVTISLSDQQIDQLKSFLLTLNDHDFVTE